MKIVQQDILWNAILIIVASFVGAIASTFVNGYFERKMNILKFMLGVFILFIFIIFTLSFIHFLFF
jgi:hypothetical protein